MVTESTFYFVGAYHRLEYYSHRIYIARYRLVYQLSCSFLFLNINEVHVHVHMQVDM